ncbi:hypothetical protein B0H13DRAFT_2411541 [Mycena leptocephala]|nr:hypothetical protein B0H13DRAFT_2411541 [Mycena leptocephala]
MVHWRRFGAYPSVVQAARSPRCYSTCHNIFPTPTFINLDLSRSQVLAGKQVPLLSNNLYPKVISWSPRVVGAKFCMDVLNVPALCSTENIGSHLFTLSEHAMGRVLKADVAPPWSISSIKRCIAKAEKKPIYAVADMYEDISAHEALEVYNSLPKASGATLEKPLVMVEPERRAGLHNRPLKILSDCTEGPPKVVKKSKKSQIGLLGVSLKKTPGKRIQQVTTYRAIFRHKTAYNTKFLDE